MNRRGFLRAVGTGLALLAAPPIVRAGSLMPVKPFPAIETKLWHHLSIIRRGSKFIYYVDGYSVSEELMRTTRDDLRSVHKIIEELRSPDSYEAWYKT